VQQSWTNSERSSGAEAAWMVNSRFGGAALLFLMALVMLAAAAHA